MIDSLKSALERALDDGYSGLWATGDMAWEFGPQKDFSKLLEYEWHLEEFMSANPELCGICQYRADMRPRKSSELAENPKLDSFVNELIAQES